MIRYLTAEQLVLMNQEVGGEGAGIRDRNLVDAAAARPQKSAGGTDAFPSLWHKAAALLHSLPSTQAFFDGNKRTAWVATRTFLVLNGSDLPDVAPADGEAFVLAVGVGAMTHDKAVRWLTEHSPAPPGPSIAAVVLAESVDRRDERLDIVGGGFEYIRLPELPGAITFSVAVTVIGEPVHFAAGIALTSMVAGPDRQALGPSTASELAYVREPDVVVVEQARVVNLALRYADLQVTEEGRYHVVVLLEDQPAVAVPFAVGVLPAPPDTVVRAG